MRHEAIGICPWHLFVKPLLLKTFVQFSQAGEEFVLTIRNPAVIEGKKGLGVSYEAFVDDVQVSHKRTPVHESLAACVVYAVLQTPHLLPPIATSLMLLRDTTGNDCMLPASAHHASAAA